MCFRILRLLKTQHLACLLDRLSRSSCTSSPGTTPCHSFTCLSQLRAPPLSLHRLPQFPPQDLPAGRLRNRFQIHDAAPQLLMPRQIRLDKRLDFFLANLRLVRHDVRARQLVPAAVRVGHADDGGVEDPVVREQQGFELRGRDLEAFVFDEFLGRCLS